ncbi:hypothetical protein LJC14_02120 [Treponema sp. OttesenSCG-928-L16]|nr:hypothetical protein [Treponema sp. OttesenSCG-928-L16]
MQKSLRFVLWFLILPSLCVSCRFFEPKTAVLWTDRPEFAVYVEYFNTSQDEYKIEARYFDSPAKELTEGQEIPDIVVGSWLKSSSTRSLFRPLDYLFKREALDKDAFYSSLLNLGNIEGKQYLFPVSFNIPALIFSRENTSLVDTQFTIDLEQIKLLGGNYNEGRDGLYTRMGFSPSWDNEFLFVITVLFGASFREGSPLAWDPIALERAIGYVQEWVRESNTSIQAEDDFSFKYLYDPLPKLAISGRILFSYMNSSDLFTLSETQRSSLDFRWVGRDGRIPLSEETVYFGLCRKGKAREAASAFTEWFFMEETQHLLLEASKQYGMNENLFGIGNGFSALRTVTEQIFPLYYPGLLGHMPPADYLSPPNILPRNWLTIKERVVLPYLQERIRVSQKEEVRALERRMTEWHRLNHSR